MKFLSPLFPKSHQPLLIYLPGMDGSGKLFYPQVQMWDNFDVRCVYLAKTKNVTWENLTEELINLIQRELRLRGKRDIYLCGESFGGCLALKLMEKIPQLLTGVVLVNSASAFAQRSWLNLGSYITEVMPDAVYQPLTLALLPFLAKLEALAKEEKEALLTQMQMIPPSIVSWRISLLKNFSLNVDKLINFPQPVLIIASEEDKLLPSTEEAKRLTRIFPHSKMSILTHSGHCCLLEKNIDLYPIIKQNLDLFSFNYSFS